MVRTNVRTAASVRKSSARCAAVLGAAAGIVGFSLPGSSARAANYLFDRAGTIDGASFNDPNNWIPSGSVPGAADSATIYGRISNIQSSITLGNLVMSSISGKGGEVYTNTNHLLTVNGEINIDGTGAADATPVRLRVHSNNSGASYSLVAGTITLVDGGQLYFATSDVAPAKAKVNTSMTIDAESTFYGNGTLEIGGQLTNDGWIYAYAGKLKLKGLVPGAFDLDGSSGHGILDATLADMDLDGDQGNDDFDGELKVGVDRTLTAVKQFTIGTLGTVNLNGGNTAVSPATFAGNKVLKGTLNASLFTAITGSTDFAPNSHVNITNAGDVLTVANGLSLDGTTVAGAGLFRTNGPLQVGDYANYRTINMNVATWDWDGNVDPDNHQTQISNCNLVLNGQRIDSASDGYDGKLYLFDQAAITCNIPGGWQLDGTLYVADGESTINGNTFTLNGSTLTFNGGFASNTKLTVNAPFVSTDKAYLTFNGGSVMTLAGTSATFGGGNYLGVVAAGTGGRINLNTNATVTGDTFFDVGTFDLDGASNASVTTINSGAKLDLDADTLDDANNNFRSTINVNGGTLDLTVLSGKWTLAGGTINLSQPAASGALVSGSELRLGTLNAKGTVNASGLAQINTKLTSGKNSAGSNVVNVAAGGTLTVAQLASEFGGAVLDKNGPGMMIVSGVQDHQPGSVINVNAGTLVLNSTTGGVTDSPNLTLNVASNVQFGFRQRLATLNLFSGATAAMTPAGTRVLRLDDLNISGGGANPTGTLDLSNNDMIVDYTAGNSPFAEIRDYLKKGYNKGNWNGLGINSSFAAANHDLGTALGIIDNTLLTKVSFSGQGVDPTTVLVKYTWYGDLDLDGDVDATDQILLNPAGTEWYQGDMNYDGKVSPDDFALFALGKAKFTIVLNSEVPEPATLLAPALLAGMSYLQRRRRA